MSLRKRGGGPEGESSGLDNESFDNDDVPRLEMNIDYSKAGAANNDGSSVYSGREDEDLPLVRETSFIT